MHLVYSNIEESTVGEMLNDEYFRKSGKLKEVANIKVKMISWEEYKKRPQINGYIHPEENPPVIYLSPVLTLDEKEYVLYHEIYHIRQKRAVSNSKYVNEFEKHNKTYNQIINLKNELKYDLHKMSSEEISEKISELNKLQTDIDTSLLENSAENAAFREYKNRRAYYDKRQ